MTAWMIAWRYLVSKKSHGAVNVISIISVAGVAVATAAIVIVLSVFNGFTSLASAHLSAIDPDLKVMPARGKTFANGDSLAHAIAALPCVAAAVPVVEERGLLIAAQEQMPVVFEGVPIDYEQVTSIDSTIIDGMGLADAYELMPPVDAQPMLASVGVAIRTGGRPAMASQSTLYVPRRVGRINPANPAAAFRGEKLVMAGVYQIAQPEYDNETLIVPLDVARRLLDYDTEATAVKVSAIGDADKAAETLRQTLGPDAKVLNRLQQGEKSYKMIMVEKWVTFLMLAFILVIASFNIISTLSLLVIEKRGNMATLRAMGASRSMVRGIFMRQGWLISMAGGVAGVVLGTLLSLAQQWGGFIKLSGDPSQLAIDTYPVRVEAVDLVIVLALVALVALCTSQATRLFTRQMGYDSKL